MSYDFSSLDFSTLKNNIINYIKDDDNFADYSFEGSALNSIANLLTYTSLQQNFYLNMTTKELYLDSASLYRNVVAIAKSLNYNPHRSISSSIEIQVDLKEGVELIENETIYFPPNCEFKINNLIFNSDTSYTFTEDELIMKLYQREVKEETFTYDSSLSSFELLYGVEIDDRYFSVFVDGVLWEEHVDDITVNGSTEIFFLYNNINEKIELSFGDNTIGKKPSNGSEIRVVYSITEGLAGNTLSEPIILNENINSNESIVYSNDDFVFTSISSSFGGLSFEDIDSIKINAPKFYEAQNRAITYTDYKTILGSISFVDAVNVWDGIEVNPPIYGTVFGTFKPIEGYISLNEEQKNDIQTTIKRYIPLSVKFVIKEPIYIIVDVSSTIYYYKSYNESISSIDADIRSNITAFFNDDLSIYDNKLKYSKLLNMIDELNVISNNLTELTCKIEFEKSISANNYYVFEIFNAIKPLSISNTFIKDDGEGNIINIIDETIIGTVEYSEGKIYFSQANMNTSNTIYFKTEIDDIIFKMNNIPVLGNINLTFNGI